MGAVVVGSAKGKLLVAAPPLADPNFDRTVVYVLEHNEEGALGVVLNRPLDDELIDGLDSWNDLLTPPSVLFEGGPVEPNALIGVARADSTRPGEGWAPIVDHLGTVDLSSEPNEVAPVLDDVRIFRGYAGWGGGQLDGELAVDAWIVVPAQLADVFTAEPDDLWRKVLRRQGGRLAWLANFPDDLNSN